MKKLTYFLLAGAVAMMACTREVDTRPVDNSEPDYDTPAAIELAANLPQVIQTKSDIGALDEWHREQKLYVYGIARGSAAAPTAAASEALDFTEGSGIYINNVWAKFPDGFGYDHPENQQKVTVNRVGDEPFFYIENRRYEFYGYYVDNALCSRIQVEAAGNTPATFATDTTSAWRPNPTLNNAKDSLCLDIKIDGSQDIMLAATDKAKDNTADLNYNRLYSAYSARKGVKPNLLFKHQLSRFNVYVRNGSHKDATTTTPPYTAPIVLSTFQVKTYDQATLKIAGKDHSQKMTVKKDVDPVFVGIWDGAQGTAKYQLEKDADNAYWWPKANDLAQIDNETDPTHFLSTAWEKVGTIMVMPGQKEYPINVGLMQKGYTGDPRETQTEYKIDFATILQVDPKDANNTTDIIDTKAEPGHAYDVNVVVYGLEEIVITVSMAPWENAGYFEIDQDKDNEVQIQTTIEGDATLGSYGNPLHLDFGQSKSMTVKTLIPTDKNVPQIRTIDWEIDNEDIVSVAATETPGVYTITAKQQAGDATILLHCAKPSGFAGEDGYKLIRVTVDDPGAPVVTPQLVLSADPAVFNKTTESVDFTPAITVEDNNGAGVDAEKYTLSFASDDAEVATVDPATGLIHIVGVGDGSATITVNATPTGTDYTAAAPIELTVNVTAAPTLTPIRAAGNAINVNTGADPLQLEITVEASNQAAVTSQDYDLYYSTDNAAVAEVDDNGLITFGTAGEADITVSIQPKTDAYAAGSDLVLHVTVTGYYTIVPTNSPRQIVVGAGHQLSLIGLLGITEGNEDIPDAIKNNVSFEITGSPAYGYAHIDGQNLVLYDGAIAGDEILIRYTIPADNDNHYQQNQNDDNTFNVLVITE